MIQCLVDGTVFGTSVYKFFSTSLVYTDARAACSLWSANAHVVTIGSQDEQDFVFQLKPIPSEAIWIGAQRDRAAPGMQFTWSDGSQFNFTLWREGEPNDLNDRENCVTMGKKDTTVVSYGAQWNDAVCSFVISFVCEQANPTGLERTLYYCLLLFFLSSHICFRT